jgi:nitrogen fixation NifU-like protein
MERSGMYNEKVMEHFKNPHNYGKIENPDGIGKAGNLVCGDIMWIYIKVGKDREGRKFIEDIKYETYGCVAAIAASSQLTDLAKGKTLDEALKIGKDSIVNELGGLPKIKVHCSLLAADALSEAIYDYFVRNNAKIPEELRIRHEKLKKEKEQIEKKYRQWIEFEEKMHSNQEKNEGGK